MRIVLQGFILVLVCVLVSGRLGGMEVILREVGLREGMVFPDLELPMLERGKVSGRVSDYRGKKLLLLVFASW